MSTIPTAYRTIIDPLIGVARDLVERGEQLVPVAFVGNLSKRETYPVLLNASSAQAKDDSAELIRQLAAIHEADFVFLIMDAWGLPPDKVRSGSHHESLHQRSRLDSVQTPVATTRFQARRVTPSDPERSVALATRASAVGRSADGSIQFVCP